MGNGQYFYDMNSLEMEFGGRKRKHRDDQQKERKKPEFDTGMKFSLNLVKN